VLGFSEADKKDSNFDEKIKQAVEDYLVHSTVRMHVYSLQEFVPGTVREEHLANVHKVSLFEKIVIDLFKKYQKKLANKKLTRLPRGKECPYPEILVRIKHDFKLRS
jgi:hypothetical protein